jgi:hypothetical protein
MNAQKPGGQPANPIARKHGLHPRVSRLAAGTPEGLEREIAMLRAALKRYCEQVEAGEDVEGDAIALNVLGLTATRLAGLLRAQKALGGGQDMVHQALVLVLEKMAQERGDETKA